METGLKKLKKKKDLVVWKRFGRNKKENPLYYFLTVYRTSWLKG